MTDKTFPPDLERVVAFHGHYCPGVLTGYLAAKIAMARLDASRAEDEELIAIVENDTCAVDAVQVLTGCTFGKGNLFFRDYGRHVYTFALRPSGKAVRIARKPRKEEPPEDETREQVIARLLAAPADELFEVDEGAIDLPDTAHIRDSIVCSRCGTPAMSTRVEEVDGRPVCRACREGNGNLLKGR